MSRNSNSSFVDGAPSKQDAQRKTERGTLTRVRILDAAEQIFAQSGFAATRIDDIAIAVGIRKPSVIHHFRGKRELHDEVMNRIFSALLEETRRKFPANTRQPDLFQLLDTWLDFIAARPAAGRLFLRAVAGSAFTNLSIGAESAELLAIWKAAVSAASARREFSDTEPLELLAIFAGAALTFVSTHPLLVGNVDAASNDRGLLEPYRVMLHRAVKAILEA